MYNNESKKKIQLKRNKFSFPSQTSPGSYCNNLLFYQYDSSLPQPRRIVVVS